MNVEEVWDPHERLEAPFIKTNSRKLLSHNDSFVLPKDMSPTRISILFWAQIYAILFYQEIFFRAHIFRVLSPSFF